MEKIKTYIKILEPSIEDNARLEFDIQELIDRVLSYTGRKMLPEELERILAKTYITTKEKELKATSVDTGEIASVSDNGQSITFKSKQDTYFVEQVLSDLQPILDKYVIGKITVIGENYANTN